MIEIKAIKRDKHRKRARLSSHIELLLTQIGKPDLTRSDENF